MVKVNVDVNGVDERRPKPLCPHRINTLQYTSLLIFFTHTLLRLPVPCNCALKLYVTSQTRGPRRCPQSPVRLRIRRVYCKVFIRCASCGHRGFGLRSSTTSTSTSTSKTNFNQENVNQRNQIFYRISKFFGCLHKSELRFNISIQIC